MGFRWKQLAKRCQKTVDYLLSNSNFETEVFRTAYWKDVPSILVGHARNDIFFIKDQEKVARINKKVHRFLNIDEDTHIFYLHRHIVMMWMSPISHLIMR